MKERWNNFVEAMEGMVAMSRREYFLSLTVCVLAGIIIGLVKAPVIKKVITIGSNNSENTTNMSTGKEECCCEGECDC